MNAPATGPQLLAASMKVPSPSEPNPSTTARSPRERRLDAGFEAFVARLSASRSGWTPAWNSNLRAELWARFALECRDLLQNSGVPVPERKWDIENIDPLLPEPYRKMAARLMKLMAKFDIIAIGGERGGGKSTLGWGLVVKFCDVGRPAAYRTVKEFFDEIGNVAWADKQRVRDRYASIDLLVLDEVQVRDADKDWQDNELTTLIDRRYRDERSTVLLSNLTAGGLEKNLGASIWRRLIETGGQPFELKGRIVEHLAKSLAEKRGAK